MGPCDGHGCRGRVEGSVEEHHQGKSALVSVALEDFLVCAPVCFPISTSQPSMCLQALCLLSVSA